MNNPTPENAARVDKVAYSDPSGRGLLSSDYQVLDTLVRYGDRSAVDLAFRLLRTSDGELAEALLITLGQTIRVNASLFLTELAKHHFTGFEMILGNLTEAYYDRPNATIAELSARRDALAEVRSARLASLRGKCMATLDELIAKEKARAEQLQSGDRP